MPLVRAMFTLGPEAVAEVIPWPGTELYALRVRLDPGEVVIGPADGPEGAAEMAVFLMALGEVCVMLASILDAHPGGRSMRGPGAVGWFTRRSAERTTDDLGETGVGRLPE
ncbi:hypothetical protein ACQPW3_11140 [Actinosynnema sp. CA-248983]